MDGPEESDDLFPRAGPGSAQRAAAASRIKAANTLRECLHRAHVRFVAFAVACVVALAVCYPRLADGQRAGALRDLAQLSGQIQLPVLRGQIARRAERALAFDLEQLAQAVAIPELTARQGAEPQAQLVTAEPPALSSLGALAGLSRAETRFTVRRPDRDALAASLRWRLDRLRNKRPLVLTQLRLSHAVSQGAVEAEASVEPARVEALQAVAAYQQSYEHYNDMRDRCDRLAKRRVPKRAMLPAVRERVAAYETLVTTKRSMRLAEEAYERLARSARRPPAAASDEAAGGSIVVATLQPQEGKPLEFQIPTARRAQLVAAPAFEAPAALTRLGNNPLWPELEGLAVPSAIEQLQREVSFHLRSTEVFGLHLTGSAALQLLLVVLSFFLWMLMRGCRAVRRVYSPFGSNQGADLPKPGTGKRERDRALLIGLPAAVCCLTFWALLRIDARPWIALILSIGLITQSVVAASMWQDLHRLLTAARQRSMLQPLPERPMRTPVAATLRGNRGSR